MGAGPPFSRSEQTVSRSRKRNPQRPGRRERLKLLNAGTPKKTPPPPKPPPLPTLDSADPAAPHRTPLSPWEESE
jgi:hypothetical protein